MTPEEILIEVKAKAKKRADWDKSLHKKMGEDGFPIYPDYTPTYGKEVKAAQRMATHIDPGVFPYWLFINKAPSETKEEFEYKKRNYRQITLLFMYRALGVIHRIFNENNWSEQFPEDESKFKDNSAKDYFQNSYPNYGSLIGYFSEVVKTFKIKDPNALIVNKPLFIPAVENDEGELVIDGSALVSPVSVIYEAWQDMGYKEGEHALVLLQEKSKVEHGRGVVEEGMIFEFYDKDVIYRITQVGRKGDLDFDITVYWEHNLGYLPVKKLKGIPSFYEGKLFYYSYLSPVSDHLEEAILDNSTLRVVKNKQAYPTRWAIVDPCSNNECDGGYTYRDGERVVCSVCKGTGNKSKFSELAEFEVVKPEKLNDNDANIPTPPFGYVSPDSTIMEFLRKETREAIEGAFALLNIDVSNSSVKGDDTALGKQIDREELFSFLMQISNEIFETYKFCVKAIGEMRYGSSFKMPAITPPITFDIRTEAERTEEISEARKNNLPDIIIRELLKQWIEQRFNGQANINNIVELVMRADRLITKDQLSISLGTTNGTVAKWEIILHDSIFNFIQEAVETDPNFFEKDLKDQVEELKIMATEKESEIAPKITESILDGAEI